MMTNCINWLKIRVFNSIVLGIKHNIPTGLDNKKYSLVFYN